VRGPGPPTRRGHALHGIARSSTTGACVAVAGPRLQPLLRAPAGFRSFSARGRGAGAAWQARRRRRRRVEAARHAAAGGGRASARGGAPRPYSPVRARFSEPGPCRGDMGLPMLRTRSRALACGGVPGASAVGALRTLDFRFAGDLLRGALLPAARRSRCLEHTQQRRHRRETRKFSQRRRPLGAALPTGALHSRCNSRDRDPHAEGVAGGRLQRMRADVNLGWQFKVKKKWSSNRTKARAVGDAPTGGRGAPAPFLAAPRR